MTEAASRQFYGMGGVWETRRHRPAALAASRAAAEDIERLLPAVEHPEVK
jgi:hypothetical protein